MDFRKYFSDLSLLIILLCIQDGGLSDPDYDDIPSSNRNGCPPIRNKLKNGRVRLRYKGRVAKFICDSGFELAGKRSSTCVRGEWSNPVPVCVARGCYRVQPVSNGRITEMYRGALLVFDCNPGYVLDGDTTIHCDGRKWNTSPPSCVIANGNPETFCDFESPDLCGWSHDPNHDFDWQRNQFSTPSGHVGTGPAFDHTFGENKGGFYLYIEASSPRKKDDTARLFSPVYPKDFSGGCFIFWYHMYGATTGGLRVYLKPESHVFDELKPNWEKYGDQGNQWQRGHMIVPFLRENFQIVIEGVRGESYVGDSAIDDVLLTTNLCDSYDNVTELTANVTHYSCRGRCQESGSETTCGCNANCISEPNFCCRDYFSICGTGNSTPAQNSDEPLPEDISETTSSLVTSQLSTKTTQGNSKESDTITTSTITEVTKIINDNTSLISKAIPTITASLNSNTSPVISAVSSASGLDVTTPLTEETMVSSKSTYLTNTMLSGTSTSTASTNSSPFTKTTIPYSTKSNTFLSSNTFPTSTSSKTQTILSATQTTSTANQAVASTTKLATSVSTAKQATLSTEQGTSKPKQTTLSTTKQTTFLTEQRTSTPKQTTLSSPKQTTFITEQKPSTPKQTTFSTTKQTIPSTIKQTTSTTASTFAPTLQTTKKVVPLTYNSTAVSNASPYITDASTTFSSIVETSSTTPMSFSTTAPSSTRKTYNLRPRNRTVSSTIYTTLPTVSKTTNSILTSNTQLKETVSVSSPTTYLTSWYRRPVSSSTSQTTFSLFTSTAVTIKPKTSPKSRQELSTAIINIPESTKFPSRITEGTFKTTAVSYDSGASKSEKTASTSNVPLVVVLVIIVIVCLIAGLVFYIRKQRNKRQSKLSDDSEMRFLQENDYMDYSDASALDKILVK